MFSSFDSRAQISSFCCHWFPSFSNVNMFSWTSLNDIMWVIATYGGPFQTTPLSFNPLAVPCCMGLSNDVTYRFAGNTGQSAPGKGQSEIMAPKQEMRLIRPTSPIQFCSY